MLRNQKKSQSGFTLVELLVVLSMMVILATVTFVSWNRQTPNRSLRIAQNEMVTNLRKVQSYAVSSRNITAGTPSSYYIIQLTKNADSYWVNALGSGNEYAFYKTLESVKLPAGLVVSDIQVTNPGDLVPTSYDCIQILVSAVYGKMYYHVPIAPLNCNSSGWEEQATDIAKHPPTLAELSSNDLEIVITHTNTGTSRSVELNGRAGRIESN